jgi:periplasmic divalent cation tolerance protein
MGAFEKGPDCFAIGIRGGVLSQCADSQAGALKAKKKYRLVMVTVPDRKTGRKLARAALTKRAAACASLVSGLESHYWWKGKLESAREFLVLFKTEASHLPSLEELVRKHHPYEVPEFIALLITDGSPAYLDWISEVVR